MLFAGLMFITLVIFAIMATTYTYIEREDDLTEEDKGENIAEGKDTTGYEEFDNIVASSDDTVEKLEDAADNSVSQATSL